MTAKNRLSRRTALKGLGAAVALPWFECMSPARLLANPVEGPATPKRLAFVFVPNGVHGPDWTPAQVGDAFELPKTLEPLTGVRDRLTVITGLAHEKARANGDGPGDHARSAATFLTGCQAYKTHGANIRVGVSVDQVAAQSIGHRTRFSSLELGCDRGAQAGNCDSGYSCAYSANISWRTPSLPMAKEVDPRLVFERLFGGDGADAEQARGNRKLYRKSVLDYVRDDAVRLRDRLGMTDRRKLDEYLAAVRDVERRIESAERAPERELPEYAKPDGVPNDYQEHMRVMFDLLALAFQGDVTRVSTFMLANEGSNRSYPFIDVPEGHHSLSHHQGDEAKQAKIAKINRFHIEQFARFLERLEATPEGEGTLLDHSMIVYGSGIGDGNRHNHNDLPILLAGGGGGTIRSGRHLKYDKDTPLANLWLSLLDRMESDIEKLGDSTGRLPEIAG